MSGHTRRRLCHTHALSSDSPLSVHHSMQRSNYHHRIYLGVSQPSPYMAVLPTNYLHDNGNSIFLCFGDDLLMKNDKSVRSVWQGIESNVVRACPAGSQDSAEQACHEERQRQHDQSDEMMFLGTVSSCKMMGKLWKLGGAGTLLYHCHFGIYSLSFQRPKSDSVRQLPLPPDK